MGVCTLIDGKSPTAAALDQLDWKNSVRAATTAALPANTRTGNRLTGVGNGALAAQDGVALALNEELLVKNEAAGENPSARGPRIRGPFGHSRRSTRSR
jgi:hypothetical protein